MKMNKKGFTIVELVIVIAVIAVLAGVLIPTFSGLVEKAQDSAVIQEARNKYTEYVGMHDYSDGTSPAQNLVIEVDDQYVIVKDGQMIAEVYKNKDDPSLAKESAKTEARYKNDDPAAFVCDEHEWKDGDDTTAPECEDCKIKCTVIKTGVTAEGGKCTVCGLTAEKHPAATPANN